MSYATVDVLKKYLGIEAELIGDDGLLQRLLDAATAKIDAETRTTFAVATDTTRYYDAEAVKCDELRLGAELLSLTSVVNGDGQAVSLSYIVGVPRNEPRSHTLRLKATAPVAWYVDDEISVTGKFGYSADPPADIVQACVRLAAYLYRQKDNSSDLDRAVVAANGTMMPTQLPKDIDQYLAPYKGARL